MLRISGAGESHVGLIRRDNQDAGFVGPSLALVADGVGGGAAGEVAAATAAYAVAAVALQHAGEDPATVLREAVRVAHAQVHAGVEADPAREGMATTLTALLTDGATFALAHLGDSRAYVFRDGGLTRVTRDHTFVQDLVEEGRLDERDVPAHPWRNVVMRSVNGSGGGPDVLELRLLPGDRVLIASDGLTDLVSEAVVADVLARRSDDDAVAALLGAALARGGRDNVTCIVATVVDGPPVAADGRVLGALCDPANVVDVAAVRSASTA